MPSAPKANAAAIEAPSTNPPAAMIGTSTSARTNGKSTMLATSRGFLNPPPSPPSTTSPSTPQDTAFLAAARLGTTWKTVNPPAFNSSVYRSGLPADVVTNFTPWSITKRTISGSRTKACAILTPKGLSVSSRIFCISIRIASSSPDEVSMIPSPPELLTADAN